MADLKKVTKRNHTPRRGENNAFLVYSTQFNELVEELSDGTADLSVGDLAVTGDLTVTGTTTLNGTLVLGDAAADALTVNATTTYAEPINYDNATTITAFATGGQASATALTAEINNVTTVATAGDSVKLPAAVAGKHIYIKNSGAAALDIFPASSDSIDALAINLAIRIQPGSSINFYAKDAIVWESSIDNSITLNSPTTVTGQLEIKASASAGNTVTTITNASQAAARTYTIPDAGASASFVMSEGAQTINGLKTFGNGIATNTIAETTALANITTGSPLIEKKSTSAAINTSATASAAQVKTGLITSTSGAAVTITLPTGTDLGTALGATQGTTFELVVDNTAGANTVTLAPGVNCISSDWNVVNDALLAPHDVVSGVTGIAVFKFMFSSATACAYTRIA
jgi:hypothetical protein